MMFLTGGLSTFSALVFIFQTSTAYPTSNAKLSKNDASSVKFRLRRQIPFLGGNDGVSWGRTNSYGPVSVSRGGGITGGLNFPGIGGPGTKLAAANAKIKELSGGGPALSIGRSSGINVPYAGTIGTSRGVNIGGLSGNPTAGFGGPRAAGSYRPFTGQTNSGAATPFGAPTSLNQLPNPGATGPGPAVNVDNCLTAVQYTGPTAAFPQGAFLDRCGRIIPAELLLGNAEARLKAQKRLIIGTPDAPPPRRIVPKGRAGKAGSTGPSVGPGPETKSLTLNAANKKVASRGLQKAKAVNLGAAEFGRLKAARKRFRSRQ